MTKITQILIFSHFRSQIYGIAFDKSHSSKNIQEQYQEFTPISLNYLILIFWKTFGQNSSILNSSCMVGHLVSPLLIEGFPMVPWFGSLKHNKQSRCVFLFSFLNLKKVVNYSLWKSKLLAKPHIFTRVSQKKCQQKCW